MITQIGLTAGDIWEHLDAREECDSLENIIDSLGKDRGLVLMSVGWLAREGHVALEGSNSNYVVSLNSDKIA
jgi:Winged helix-turn-helix domain (DUF2582)